MHRPEIIPATVARALHASPKRRRAREVSAAIAATVDGIGRIVGTGTVPHRLARRLGRFLLTAPPAIDVFDPGPTAARPAATGRRVLLVSNDLSRSGAPRVVVELARLLAARGDRITVLSGADGPHRDELLAEGLTVIVDPSIMIPQAPLPIAIAKGFDVVLCNTIATASCAASIAGEVPTILYVHEVSLLEERMAESPETNASLAKVAEVWAGSELSAGLLRPVRPDVLVMPYGLDPIRDANGDLPPIGPGDPSILVVLASFEPRKGQDLLVEAFALLDPAVRASIRIRMYGRILFPDFHAALAARVAQIPEISLHGPLDADAYRAAVLASDAVLVPSRSDTLPLVSLDALGAGRVLFCTTSTGTAAYIESGKSGFVAKGPTAIDLAAMLDTALARRAEWPSIAITGQAVFTRHFSQEAFAALVGKRFDALTADLGNRA